MSEQKIIPFMAYRKVAFAFSILLTIIAIGAISIRGLNFGLDFTGGTLVEVGYESSANLDEIREALASAGYGNAVVQHFGTESEVMIRVQSGASNKLGDEIVALLQAGGQKVDLRRVEFVGPQVGDDLKESGIMALLVAFIGILVYVGVRFQYKFSVGAVASLIHDVIITIGFFALFQWEFDLTVLAAVLTIIGYSINDTIVVFDRVRENFRLMRKTDPVELIDVAMTQTLSRTTMTSFTTLLAVCVLLFVGGDMVHRFALALTIGIAFGTYSSVYIASGLLLTLNICKEDLMDLDQKKMDGEEEYETP